MGVAAFFLVLFLMSQFIWNITIEGNHRFTDDMILHTLSELEIYYGMRKKQVNCQVLEEELRSRYEAITWVSAQVSGTRLMIRVKENEGIGEIPEKETTPRHLVADQDGIVTKIMVRKGKAQVQVGDKVTRGQVLISGILPVYDDSMTLVKEEYVRADGDILARVSSCFEEQIPCLATVRTKTGRKRYGAGVRLGNWSFVWMLPVKKDTDWKFTRETRQLVLLDDFFLPFWTERILGEEYVIYERNWTDQELEGLKERINSWKIQNLMEKGVQIIENNVRILKEDSCWKIRSDMVLEKSMGVGEIIYQEEEIRQPNERD